MFLPLAPRGVHVLGVLAEMAAPQSSRERLHRLAESWESERLATRRQARALREALSFEQRVERGLALDGLRYENSEGAGAGRFQIWFRLEHAGLLENAKLRVGDPIVLWATASSQRQTGVVGRRGQTRLSIIVNSNDDAWLEQGPIRLDIEASEITFDRGAAAITEFLDSKELKPLRELCFGEALPTFGAEEALEYRDQSLDESQRQAVALALRAHRVALIHGPPGTGKTRTLVEVIRQQLLRRRSVLVTAASNTAVDHLTRQLIAVGVKPLRLGHPARTAEDLRPCTAEVMMEAAEEYKLAKKWQTQARALRDKVRTQPTRAARAAKSAQGDRDALQRASKLDADARRALKEARSSVLRRCRVVCTTAAGADANLLGHGRYDVVVLDEATQAPDPIALAALQRSTLAILAGDPCQLSPTVIDPDAARAGLASTLFERASSRWPAEATHLLRVQYRMHEGLMRFPSISMYQGRLVADPSAASRRLEDLPGVTRDPSRASPWVFVDTTGAGSEELIDEESLSTSNELHAGLAAVEVERLLARGLAAQDIAAITPYGAQVRLLRRLLADAVRAGLEIGTVDGFQGREKEAVVVDLVRSNSTGNLGFLKDVRRTNVALTRAKRSLIVIGNGQTLATHDYYRALLDAAQQAGVLQRYRG